RRGLRRAGRAGATASNGEEPKRCREKCPEGVRALRPPDRGRPGGARLQRASTGSSVRLRGSPSTCGGREPLVGRLRRHGPARERRLRVREAPTAWMTARPEYNVAAMAFSLLSFFRLLDLRCPPEVSRRHGPS